MIVIYGLELFSIDQEFFISQQNYSQFMNPQPLTIKSDHALKKSVNIDQLTISHFNPINKRSSANKRNSLNITYDNANLNVSQIKFQSPPQTNNQKSLNPEQNTQTVQEQKMINSSQSDRKIRELTIRIQRIEIELDRQNRKMGIIQHKKENEGESNKKQSLKLMIKELIKENQENYEKQTSSKFESVRNQLRLFSKKIDVDKKIYNFQKSFEQIQTKILKNQQLLEVQMQRIVNSQEIKKQKEFTFIQKVIEQQCKLLEEKLIRGTIKGKDNENGEKIKNQCQKIFLGSPILLRLENRFMISSKKKDVELERNEVVYKIDYEGYLLDEDNKYLLDENNRQIKLSSEQLLMLKEKKVLR